MILKIEYEELVVKEEKGNQGSEFLEEGGRGGLQNIVVEKVLEGRKSFRRRIWMQRFVGKVGGIGGNLFKMVFIIFIVWEVRLVFEGNKGVWVDGNVLVNCGGEFYRVLVLFLSFMVVLCYVC